MNINPINNYLDFIKMLNQVGFSMGGSNGEGIFSIASCYTNNIKAHTEDLDTDPWEWRMRVLEERKDIAYAKLFFKKSGYITKEWYPYFLAVRRDSITFEEAYYNGNISREAKIIYEIIESNDNVALHIIKQLGGFTKENKSKFERAMVELQTKMYITMYGRQQKVSSDGKTYGWSSTSFCTVERFFDNDVFEKAELIDREHAESKIKEQILKLNPQAEHKKIQKFIYG